MHLPAPTRRDRPESIVPMINVVFLLLVFFLMTATIAPAEPFAVTPPASRADLPAPAERLLWLGPDGRLAHAGQAGEAALAALAAAGPGPVTIRADRQAEGAALARLLTRLAALGITETLLVVEAAP